ncbi:hypothetical protein FOZ62_003635, partial [Perkinsus olseni]
TSRNAFTVRHRPSSALRIDGRGQYESRRRLYKLERSLRRRYWTMLPIRRPAHRLHVPGGIPFIRDKGFRWYSSFPVLLRYLRPSMFDRQRLPYSSARTRTEGLL